MNVRKLVNSSANEDITLNKTREYQLMYKKSIIEKTKAVKSR